VDGGGVGGSSSVGTSVVVVVVVDGLLDKQKCTGLTSGDCKFVIVQRHFKNWPTFEFIGSGGCVMCVGRGRRGKEEGQEEEETKMVHRSKFVCGGRMQG